MKRWISILLVGALSACGSWPLRAASGSLSLKLEFPLGFKTQLIPEQTHAVYVLVHGASLPLNRPLLPRPLTPANSSLTVPNVPVGMQNVLVAAMDCQGNILTSAKATARVTPAPEVTPVSLELLADGQKQMSAEEFSALDQIVPDCASASPSPTPSPTPNSGTGSSEATPQPSNRPETPSPSTAPTPVPSALPSPSISPAPASQFLKLSFASGPRDSILLKAEPSPDLAVKRIDFLINQGKVGSAEQSPFEFSWGTEKRSSGQYTLQAIAYDAENHEIARSPESVVLLIIRDQPYKASGGGGSSSHTICTVGLNSEGEFDFCQSGGAGFGAEVTVIDGDSGLDPIEVESP